MYMYEKYNARIVGNYKITRNDNAYDSCTCKYHMIIIFILPY